MLPLIVLMACAPLTPDGAADGGARPLPQASAVTTAPLEGNDSPAAIAADTDAALGRSAATGEG